MEGEQTESIEYDKDLYDMLFTTDEEKEIIDQMNSETKAEKEKLRKDGEKNERLVQTKEERFEELMTRKLQDKEYIIKLDRQWKTKINDETKGQLDKTLDEVQKIG